MSNVPPLRLGPFASTLLIAAGCGSPSEDASSGRDEPLAVRYEQLETLPDSTKQKPAQFIPLPLPESADGPTILVETVQRIIPQGLGGKKFTGSVGPESEGVGLRFADLGTGYWRVPVGSPDLQIEGSFTWNAFADFSRNLPPGKHTLEFAALRNNGSFGPKSTLDVLVQSIRTEAPVVISLEWDNAADLDLLLITPGGKLVSSKKPTTVVNTAMATSVAHRGVLNRDSNVRCQLDAYQEEDVSWGSGENAPLTGTYFIYVDMFDACGQPASTFTVRVSTDGQEVRSYTGRLLSIDADGGNTNGLFIAKIPFQ